MMRALLTCAMVLLAASPALAQYAQQQQKPVITDSRIKTLVYNENDVYSLMTHYGYQANIEFGPKERIETISLGDRIGWQVIPAGRRIFVRPLEESSHTNMTVITTEHTYQFDLHSDNGGPLLPNEELVYVVRFYYPQEDLKNLPPVYASQVAPASYAAPMTMMPAQTGYNYRYTFTGPDALAPVKVYDDGQTTYLQLNRTPDSIGIVTPDGRETPLSPTMAQDGSVQIHTVSQRLVLRYGNDIVCIFNEAR